MRSQIPVALVVAAATSAASADAIFSFGFTDLSGAYTNVGTPTFTATANAGSEGNVNRLIAPSAGTAVYGTGSAVGLVNLSLTVSGIGPTSANGSGSITIFDADGDRFQSQINGTFSLSGGTVFFNGALANPQLIPDATTNNLFNGPTSGAFPLSFAPATGPFTGAIVQLFFDAGTFFAQPFSNVNTLVTGQVIPTPGAMALLAGGGLLAARRRRR
jgi:hypothetical protein